MQEVPPVILSEAKDLTASQILITANVDNDATGITGYSLAGAQYGYGLLWAVVLVTISLAVVQEMVARMGVVTGKGLADLIRERFGVKITFWSMVLLLRG